MRMLCDSRKIVTTPYSNITSRRKCDAKYFFPNSSPAWVRLPNWGTVLNSWSMLDCTQSISFLLVIERLERTRCATARETGVSKIDGSAKNRAEKRRVPLFFRPSSPFSTRPCLSLAPVSQLLWTRKERDCVEFRSMWMWPNDKRHGLDIMPHLHVRQLFLGAGRALAGFLRLLLERRLPVQSLRYRGAAYFQRLAAFGLLIGKGKLTNLIRRARATGLTCCDVSLYLSIATC